MYEYLKDFLNEYDFSDEAKESCLDCFLSVRKNSEAAEKLDFILGEYEKSPECDYELFIKLADEIAKLTGLHRFTVFAVMFIALSKKLKDYYKERGYDLSIYRNSMADIKYKTLESEGVHNVWGIACPTWYPLFYRLKRFAFGKLQFEEMLYPLEKPYVKNGYIVKKGDTVINIHLPRTQGKLYYSDVEESYRQAAEFFKSSFIGRKIVFMCNTWLFFEKNLEFYKPGSNLNLFCKDFEMIDSGYYDDYTETWRLFNVQYTGDADALPGDTSFQRLYKDLIKSNQKTGWSRGIYIYN